MQELFCKWLDEKGLRYIDELHVPEVKRRADFVVLKPTNGLINIEAKCDDFACMMKQLEDHAKYCQYSFAFIQSRALTPMWFKNFLAKSGYGLIIYNWETKSITEVFEAHQNKIQKEFKSLNKEVMKKINDKYIELDMFKIEKELPSE
jgi:hypothetical protein